MNCTPKVRQKLLGCSLFYMTLILRYCLATGGAAGREGV